MAAAAIATVTAIEGTAYARNAEGELRELRVGDQLRQGETLVTPEGSRVELELVDGQALAIADVPEVRMDADMLAELAAGADEAALRDATLDDVIAALEGDGDLSEVLEATAAGAGADGTNAGSSFIRLARISEDTPEFSGLRSASNPDENLFVEQAEQINGADASPDSGETPRDTPITIPVLVNDNFVEGAVVTAVSNPANGTATINADGTVTYTPSDGFTGLDTFTYTVVTPDGNVSDSAAVTIDVTAVEPEPAPEPAPEPEPQPEPEPEPQPQPEPEPEPQPEPEPEPEPQPQPEPEPQPEPGPEPEPNVLADDDESASTDEGVAVGGNVLDNTNNPDGPEAASVTGFTW
ncbi:retention module-containing protein, partial [Pseudohaliea sp.]|uniref:retention module-containing protein n=1 Tax=Pseudohaliea sp. TaxID=2740289 RepID=UPI0032EC325D